MKTARSKYEKGKKFRVIKAGARLSGYKPTAPYCQTGWGRPLEVGEVITCAGESMTFGDGVPAIKWLDADGKWIANDCIFSPVQGGMWGGQAPEDGYLEPVDGQPPATVRHRVSVTVEVTLDTTPGEASEPGNVIMAAVEAVRDGEGVIVAHEIVK